MAIGWCDGQVLEEFQIAHRLNAYSAEIDTESDSKPAQIPEQIGTPRSRSEATLGICT